MGRVRPSGGGTTGRLTPAGGGAALSRLLLALAVLWSGCLQRPTANPDIIVISLANGPNNLDPRVAVDDVSQKIHALIYDNLMELDDHFRVVPKLAERIDHPDPLTYVTPLRRGVRFHDGHELTADDVVYTFRSFLDPAFISPRKGAYRELASVEARDRYTVVFTLNKVFPSFPINLFMPIVPNGAGSSLREHPVGTGPYRFESYAVDDSVRLTAFADYFEGAPRNAGLVLKIVPDEVMRGLELRKGTLDLVINDTSADIVFQLKNDPALQVVEAPGADYQYIGLNLQDPLLRDVRVRQALALAIDRQSIVDHLRRGLAVPAHGMLPPISWAVPPDLPALPFDPARARDLLDAAGYPDPDGGGPLPRFTLTLKASNIEFNRLQAAVIQENLRAIGIELDVRSYEFATLFADVLAGNFQMYFLQWTSGSLADPDILRRAFHSAQVPPAGFNRGRYRNPVVDDLLDRASGETDDARRLALYHEAQRVLATDLPYISIWHKTNVAVARRSLSGVTISPLANLLFLKNVARIHGGTN